MPSWLIVACAVAVAGVLVWIVAKALKWVLWLVLIAAAAACALAAVRILLR
jgi:hypothetical protein